MRKILILTVSLLAVACTSAEKKGQTLRKVKCESARLVNDNLETAVFSGKVAAAADVNLGFRIPGIVEAVLVKEGDFVNEGQIVARLDDRDYALQLAATQAEYDGIKAEVDRVVALWEDKSVSANDYDKATNGLRAITAKLSAHKNALEDTKLRASMSGYIHKANFEKGEAVAAGTPVVAIISSSAPEITVDIPAAYFLKQNSFEGASASVDLYGDTEFNLVLKGINPRANLNQLYRATFVVEKTDEKLPAVGMVAQVKMTYSVDESSVVEIPFSAIIEKGAQSSLWVFRDGAVESREVQVVEITSGGMARVVSGLSPGEEVVVAGVRSLTQGQKVSKLEEASLSNVGGVK